MAFSNEDLSTMDSIIKRYPRSRSAIMPLLHFVQAKAGYVTNEGIEVIAQLLDLEAAEVTAVSTFYTQYKPTPVGEYHVGVCTNTLCAIMGGDAIFASLKDHLGIGNDEVTADGKVSLEHIECNAACDYAPVVMANWEFYDNQTVESAKELVDSMRAGNPKPPTRGPSQADIPANFTVHPKLLPQLLKRTEMLNDGTVDWAAGEMFAFGSLLLEGHPIRMSGQDVRRGTFSNRHAVVVDKETGADLFPLRSLVNDPNQFHIYDSFLSEYAVMGFEYGYSVERENALVIWEAQFGDFANGAQTIVDEFISSALQKWGERSSIVLLLPHGYEGQGPDHSSGRIERFLTLCAEQNMTVAQPSTPASYFHLLRWHMKNPARRPLVVFEPKSMLRLKAAASGLSDFTTGTFKPLIPDDKVKNATRLIFTSGKIYYELLAEREKLNESSTAIVRVEQLYPLPIEQMIEQAKAHPNATLLWVQDEPANQGPWPFIALTAAEAFVAHEELNGRSLRRVSRRATASPATGNHHLHEEEEKALMTEAFTR